MGKKYSNIILNLCFGLTAAVISAFDQWTKYIINIQPPEAFPVEIVPGILYIARITNTGAAFGIFPDRTTFFIIISIIALILIIILKIKLNLKSVIYNISLGFIAGGAIGNLIDRILREGEVTDFLHLMYFAVFNVADSFIVIGFTIIIIIILRTFFKKSDPKKIEQRREP